MMRPPNRPRPPRGRPNMRNKMVRARLMNCTLAGSERQSGMPASLAGPTSRAFSQFRSGPQAPPSLRRYTGASRVNRRRPLLRPLFEEPQIRRRLVLAGRHQVAVAGEEVALALDDHVAITLRAVLLGPVLLFLRVAAVLLGHRPRPRQRLVDGRDLVEHRIG